MGLKLTITSEQQRSLGMRASIVFGAGGGSIGRAADNDWVLPDPRYYLSAHHARVQFKHGAYYLLDTSSNGVYVNDATTPIGRRSTFALHGGERLRLGDYDLAVSIAPDATADDAAEAASITPVNAELALEDLISTRGDIGADLNVRDLLVSDPSPSASGRIGPVDAFGQPVWALPASDQGGPPPPPARSPGPPAAAAAALREPRSAERAPAEIAAGIEAFYRGAGIDLTHLPADTPARLHLAGVLLREALVGVKGLALTQREIRDQTQIDIGKQDPQHLGLTGLTVEDLLTRLLLGHEQHELDAVQWLRDTLGGSRRHDVATMRALHTALAEFVARLNPSALAQSAADRPAPGSRASGGRPYYENDGGSAELAARFHSITEMSDGKLPHLFMEAFARAYAAEFRRPNGSGAKP